MPESPDIAPGDLVGRDTPDGNAGTTTDAQPAQVAANAPPAEPVAAAPQATSEPQTATADTSSVAGRPTSAAAAPASPAPVTTAGAQQPTAQVIDLDGVRAEERRATLAYVAEVHELCAIAGRGDLAAGYIARAAPVAQVRKSLLEARAAEDEATAIRSRVRPTVVEPAQPTIDTAAIYAARNQNVR